MPAIWVDDNIVVSDEVRPEGREVALSVKLKPCLPSAAMAYHSDMAGLSGEPLAARLAAFIAKYVVEWDLTDLNEKPVQVSADSVRHIPSDYQYGIEAAILKTASKLTDTKKKSDNS